jgi:TetR/AcrR family transcriptional repressor of nem operon
MGRKKLYKRGDLVAAAQPLFHAHGYAGTSTEMLVDGLGVNRNTMYGEFGSKRGLFEAALDRYNRGTATDILGVLERGTAGLDEIDGLLRGFVATAGAAAGLGCLLCNTAVELGGLPEGEPFAQRYLARLHAAFRTALMGARTRGQLVRGVRVDDEARFLAAACLGIFVMVRARAGVDEVGSAVRAARRHVASLRLTSR